MAAKEKSIDSLRTQLATAKGSLEAYTQESEAMLQQRDGEVSETLSCACHQYNADACVTAVVPLVSVPHVHQHLHAVFGHESILVCCNANWEKR